MYSNRSSRPLAKIGLVLFGTLALMAAVPVPLVVADEPYQANWQSLQRYECPDWFRDAKFGIYAHWGVYSAVKGSQNTDWYSRNMYKPGHPNYVEHMANHGPVLEFGYKDLIPAFTAEKFDAEEWAVSLRRSGSPVCRPRRRTCRWLLNVEFRCESLERSQHGTEAGHRCGDGKSRS